MASLAPADIGRRSPLECFEGDISHAGTSWLYKAGLLFVAIVMVLLPACYLALIALAALATWFHITSDIGVISHEGGFSTVLIYVAPIVIGVTLIAFMLKPLFARRASAPVTFALEPAQEPLLFAFVERVCRLVRAPVPKRIDVNCEVNASASFRRGLLSLASHDLVLTLGLPLVAGLNMRQFAGVLAHELGHFSQGAGMRLSYVIRQINAWFARLVFDPDRWDLKLERAAKGIDWRVALMLHGARAAVWVTRQILRALMNVGHAVSCFMLRQMEYDADSYECKVSGSDALEETVLRINTLGFAAQSAIADLRESWRSGRLPDDFPAFVNRKASLLPAEAQHKIKEHLSTQKTALFHTHPSDMDRVSAARKIGAPGVFNQTAPAAELFARFPQLCQTVSRFYYEKQQQVSVQSRNLVPTEQLVQESATQAEVGQALHRFLYGIDTLFHPVAPQPEAMPPPVSWDDSVSNLQRFRQRLADLRRDARKAMKVCAQADQALIHCAVAKWLLLCGFSIKGGQSGLPKSLEEAARASAAAASEMERAGAALQAFAEATSQRLAITIRVLAEPSLAQRLGMAGGLSQEAANLAKVLAGLGLVFNQLHYLRRNLPALDSLLSNRPNHEKPEKVDSQILALVHELEVALVQIQQTTQAIIYPFLHVRGQVSVAEYARADGQYDNPVQAAYVECRSHLDRLFSLYFRALGRLALIAQKIERELGFPEDQTDLWELEDNSAAEGEVAQKGPRCVACGEPIPPKAKLCPTCGWTQPRQRQ